MHFCGFQMGGYAALNTNMMQQFKSSLQRALNKKKSPPFGMVIWQPKS